MRAIVVYESMYGNTHRVAEAVGDGMRSIDGTDVMVVPVGSADAALATGCDLLVVGGPTHAHGMSRARTRESAAADVDKPERDLVLDPDAAGPGLRDWFRALGTVHADGAAFDTRFDMPAIVTGRASRGIAHLLAHHGVDEVAVPESFFVTRENQLADREESRARQWGADLARRASRRTASSLKATPYVRLP
jgi:hypothetical protein